MSDSNKSNKRPTAVEFYLPGYGKLKVKVLSESALNPFTSSTFSNLDIYIDEVLKRGIFNYRKTLKPWLEDQKKNNKTVYDTKREEIFWLCASINPLLIPIEDYVLESMEKEEDLIEALSFKRTPSQVEKLLARYVKGQKHIIEAIMDILYRGYAGLKDEHRPVAVILLSGPTGTGKTLLAKVLSSLLYSERKPDISSIHSPSNFLRVDCSEYTHKGDINRLIGSPPGFIGHDEGSPLAIFLKKTPEGGVILFDEAEKADESFRNFLLGLFDRGEMTDNTGEVISCRNHIFIMTTNIGSKEAAEEMSKNPIGFCGVSDGDICIDNVERRFVRLEKTTKNKLQEVMPPEFLNRLDANLVFDYLGKQHLRNILRNEFKAVENRMNRNSHTIEITKKAEDKILLKANTDIYGAREIRRVIEKDIVTPLARQIGKGKLSGGKEFVVDLCDDSISIEESNGES